MSVRETIFITISLEANIMQRITKDIATCKYDIGSNKDLSSIEK